jgi:hypothetical protein
MIKTYETFNRWNIKRLRPLTFASCGDVKLPLFDLLNILTVHYRSYGFYFLSSVEVTPEWISHMIFRFFFFLLVSLLMKSRTQTSYFLNQILFIFTNSCLLVWYFYLMVWSAKLNRLIFIILYTHTYKWKTTDTCKFISRRMKSKSRKLTNKLI